MYLRSNRRIKRRQRTSLLEHRREQTLWWGKVVQRQVLYLGEINDNQHQAWCRVIEAFDEKTQQRTQLALFPAQAGLPEHARGYGVQIRLEAMELGPSTAMGRVLVGLSSL